MRRYAAEGEARLLDMLAQARDGALGHHVAGEKSGRHGAFLFVVAKRQEQEAAKIQRVFLYIWRIPEYLQEYQSFLFALVATVKRRRHRKKAEHAENLLRFQNGNGNQTQTEHKNLECQETNAMPKLSVL